MWEAGFVPRLALPLLFAIAGPGIASSAAADNKPPGTFSAPANQAEQLSVSTKRLGDVPYLEISVPSPKRIIILVHGGPEIPTLDGPGDFDRYLATRFQARVIKPAYYGSSERSPWTTTPNFDAVESSKDEVGRRFIQAVRLTYAGMPRSVDEVRRFILHWDRPNTIILGESHGALVAALAAQAPHRGKLVLVAPMLLTQQEMVEAVLAGTYQPAKPVEPVRIVLDGRDLTDEIFDTPAKRKAAFREVSLAYYRPWENTDLGTMLRRVVGSVAVIIGLRDRVAMITGEEWRRLRATAPPTTSICLDSNLGHQAPTSSPPARACLDKAVLDDPRSGATH